MKTSTFAAKVWRWCSTLLAAAAIIWTYSVNPESVAVDFDEGGNGSFFLTKGAVFYIAAALFILNNAVVASIKRQIPKIPVSMMPIPNRKAWALNRPELDEFLGNWLYSMVGTINVVLGISLFALATVNSEQFRWRIFDFAWVGYGTIFLFLIVLVAVPLQLFRPPVPQNE